MIYVQHEDQCTMYVRTEGQNRASHNTETREPPLIVEERDSETTVVKGKSIETMPDQFDDKDLKGYQADHAMNAIRRERRVQRSVEGYCKAWSTDGRCVRTD